MVNLATTTQYTKRLKTKPLRKSRNGKADAVKPTWDNRNGESVTNNNYKENTKEQNTKEQNTEEESVHAPDSEILKNPKKESDEDLIIRDSEKLEEVLLKMYLSDEAKLNRVKDRFAIYKAKWTKSAMRASVTKFSDYYFSKDGATPIYGEKKADTAFCNALSWLSKDFKDLGDESKDSQPKNQNITQFLRDRDNAVRNRVKTKIT